MRAITVRISDETIQELDELAQAMDRSRSWVVTDALARYLETERLWLERVKRGTEEIERGEGIPLDEAMAELRRRVDRRAKAKTA